MTNCPRSLIPCSVTLRACNTWGKTLNSRYGLVSVRIVKPFRHNESGTLKHDKEESVGETRRGDSGEFDGGVEEPLSCIWQGTDLDRFLPPPSLPPSLLPSMHLGIGILPPLAAHVRKRACRDLRHGFASFRFFCPTARDGW